LHRPQASLIAIEVGIDASMFVTMLAISVAMLICMVVIVFIVTMLMIVFIVHMAIIVFIMMMLIVHVQAAFLWLFSERFPIRMESGELLL